MEVQKNVIHKCKYMYHKLFFKDPAVYVYVPWTIY